MSAELQQQQQQIKETLQTAMLIIAVIVSILFLPPILFNLEQEEWFGQVIRLCLLILLFVPIEAILELAPFELLLAIWCPLSLFIGLQAIYERQRQPDLIS